MDGWEEAGGSTWMAGRRWDEAPRAAWWQGGAGRGGEQRGGRAVPVGEGAAWRRPALGMEERADPFCVRSVLMEVTEMKGGVFFFSTN